MTKLNRGRAFYATPERLGEYVLVDFVGRRTKRRLVDASSGASIGGGAAAVGAPTMEVARGQFVPYPAVPARAWARSSRSGRRSPYSIMGAMAGRGAAARELQRAPGRRDRQQARLPAGDLPGHHRRAADHGRGCEHSTAEPAVAGARRSSCTSITLTYALTVQRNALHHLIELTSTPPAPGTPPGRRPGGPRRRSRRSSAAGCSWAR